MRDAKSCLSPQALFVLEARRMVREAAKAEAGMGVKAQIRSAAKNLGIEYGMAWRAWQGRIGARAFPTLRSAYLAWDSEHATVGRAELIELRERIARLERIVDRGNTETQSETRKLGPRPRMGAGRLSPAPS